MNTTEIERWAIEKLGPEKYSALAKAIREPSEAAHALQVQTLVAAAKMWRESFETAVYQADVERSKYLTKEAK
jgi:hypothetical protein